MESKHITAISITHIEASALLTLLIVPMNPFCKTPEHPAPSHQHTIYSKILGHPRLHLAHLQTPPPVLVSRLLVHAHPDGGRRRADHGAGDRVVEAADGELGVLAHGVLGPVHAARPADGRGAGRGLWRRGGSGEDGGEGEEGEVGEAGHWIGLGWVVVGDGGL
jgi:hypothetical protein